MQHHHSMEHVSEIGGLKSILDFNCSQGNIHCLDLSLDVSSNSSHLNLHIGSER